MIIGIDLGTTNSLVSVFRNQEPELIPNSLNELLTPSVVGLDDDGRIIVGKVARERLLTHPDKTTSNFKRYMGSDRQIKIGNKKFRPEELSALVLRSLKADAEEYLGEEVSEAVITVPAYFNDSQRKATRAAGVLAGLKVDRLLNEPTAAALAYGLHNKEEQRYLVFDLGGGTFDISIVEFFDNILEVHASAGDNFLGGNDFTDAIFSSLSAKVTESLSIDGTNISPVLRERLWKKAEEVKCQLTKSEIATVNLHWNETPFSTAFSQEDFESLVINELDRIAAPIRRALRDSKLKVSDLNEIVLVGGATRMPIVRRLVSKLFQRFPASEIDPDKVVAVGAAIQAALKAKNEARDDMVMTDVCPYTLGVEVAEGNTGNYEAGYFLPIIERNSFIPVSRERSVRTLEDQQRHIEVKVYQGESPRIADNIFLGQLSAKVPPNKAGHESASIRFTYDVNGLLEVEVTIDSNQMKYATTIEKNPGVLSAKEIEQRLKQLEKLKIHPRDKQINQMVISRAERIYEELLGAEREHIGKVLAEFNSILNEQDERQIKTARAQLEEILDQFEEVLL